MDLSLPASLVDKLLRHLDLLAQWNRRYNLTAIQTGPDMVTHHLLDCLAVVPYAPAGRLLDLGTGAGFPGVPLALARPEDHYTLVDSSLKRIRFVRHVKAQLKLTNVETRHCRAEALHGEAPFDGVVARAFRAPQTVLSLAAPLLAPGGRCVVMCGQAPATGNPAPGAFTRVWAVPLRVPFLAAIRHLLIGERS